MGSSRLAISIGIFLTIFGLAHQLYAEVRISEVMYDLQEGSDADHEWVELYNDGESTVSLSGWKINDGSNHNLNEPPTNGGQGELSISPNGYVILSGNAGTFMGDYPGFSGTVIDTVLSLGNTEETITLISQSGGTVDSVSYTSDQGGNGDGKTLNRNGGDLVPGTPTPGYENDVNDSFEEPSGNENSNSEDENDSSDESDTTKPKERPIKTNIISETKTFTGVPLTFTSKTFDKFGREEDFGQFVWSFGDGSTKVEMNPSEFTHTYEYPGEYVVILDYHLSSYEKPDAVDRVTIRVLPATVIVQQVFPDGSIELLNQSTQEIDLKGWSIIRTPGKYIIPYHIVILPKKKIRLQTQHFGWSPPLGLVYLMDPSGKIVLNTPEKTTLNKGGTLTGPLFSSAKKSIAEKEIIEERSTDQTANAFGSEISQKQLVYMGFGLTLFIGVLSLLYIHKEREDSKEDTYEIEEIK